MNSSPGDHYWLEMFHRTLFQGNQSAMEQFQQHFSKVVLDWLRLHPKREEVYRYEREEYYLVQTFACFWQATAYHRELKFSHLAAVLRYLQASLNGVIIDTLRTNSCTREVSLPGPDYSKESVATAHENTDEVWKNIWSLLPDTREQRLAYLLFHCGLKPGEVTRCYPQEFSDGREISRLRHNIIERVVLAQE
jgi:hypothetical protein